MNVDIKVTDTKIAVTSPYNSNFVAAAKQLNGKWNAPSWVFDAREEERVRSLCRQHYGTDGITSDLCTIRCEYNESDRVYTGPIEAFGRTVARAYNRDSGAKLGDGVVCLSGGFGSGGSMKNWRTTVEDGTVVLVRDVPRSTAEAALDEGATWFTIEQEGPTIDRGALSAERAKLSARIAEIDALLLGDE